MLGSKNKLIRITDYREFSSSRGIIQNKIKLRTIFRNVTSVDLSHSDTGAILSCVYCERKKDYKFGPLVRSYVHKIPLIGLVKLGGLESRVVRERLWVMGGRGSYGLGGSWVVTA